MGETEAWQEVVSLGSVEKTERGEPGLEPGQPDLLLLQPQVSAGPSGLERWNWPFKRSCLDQGRQAAVWGPVRGSPYSPASPSSFWNLPSWHLWLKPC